MSKQTEKSAEIQVSKDVFMVAVLMGILLFLSAPVFAICNARVVADHKAGQFLDRANGAILDSKTGLLWVQCSQGLVGDSCQTGTVISVDWQQALDVANNSNFLGYTDWRLPNVKELASLVEKSCHSPAIQQAIFPATSAAAYWTSTPYSAIGDEAWIVDFTHGFSTAVSKTANARVRLVRGGY